MRHEVNKHTQKYKMQHVNNCNTVMLQLYILTLDVNLQIVTECRICGDLQALFSGTVTCPCSTFLKERSTVSFHKMTVSVLSTLTCCFFFISVPLPADSFTPTGPSGTNIIIGSVAGAILLAAIVLGGTGWGFK